MAGMVRCSEYLFVVGAEGTSCCFLFALVASCCLLSHLVATCYILLPFVASCRYKRSLSCLRPSVPAFPHPPRKGFDSEKPSSTQVFSGKKWNMEDSLSGSLSTEERL